MHTINIEGVKYRMLTEGEKIKTGDRYSDGESCFFRVGLKAPPATIFRPIPLKPKKPIKKKAVRVKAWVRQRFFDKLKSDFVLSYSDETIYLKRPLGYSDLVPVLITVRKERK